MDPSNIVSIIELSTSALKLGLKVYDEFFGHDPSVKKLQRLNVRLQGLHELLQKIAKSGIALLNAQYLGTATTLRECKAFLNDYEATLSSKSGIRVAVQRTGFLFSESRLEGFNKRIDDHFQELSTYMNVELMNHSDRLVDEIAVSRPNRRRISHGDQLVASPEPIPQRRLTGETLTDGGSISLPNPRPPILDVPSRPLSVTSSLEQLVVPLLEDTGPASSRSSRVECNGTSSFLSPTSSHGINGSTSYPASIAEDEEDVQDDPTGLPEGRPRRDDQPVWSPQLRSAPEEITVVQNGIQGRPLKLLIHPPPLPRE
ncbi:hypothetical protein PG997_002698 [Apiospora hydei]|uniref:Fungal N-terminal domain-containing protein n=1 Tax=Apiospora hydei TaxID=1337664 RepID=A0ABR1WXB8_9PEZI